MDRITATVLMLALTATLPHLATCDRGRKMVCRYYKGSPQTQGLGSFTPENIPLDLCPLVTYQSMDFPVWRKGRYEFSPEEIKQVANFQASIRRKAPTTKIIVSIDGVSDGGERFSQAADIPQRRKALVKELVRLTIELALEGIEVDWEWPALDGEYVGAATDRDNMLALLGDLRKALAGAGLSGTELWFYGSMDPTVVRRAYRIEDLCSLVDYVVLFSIGLRAQRIDLIADVTNPMRNRSFESGPRARTNVIEGLKLWLDGGCPPRKLIFTVSPVAQSLELVDPARHELGDAIKGLALQGNYLAKGRHPYYELCSIFDSSWTYKFDSVGLMPYAYRGNVWISYENLNSLRHKLDVVEEKRLAGVEVQFVHLDDFRGTCGRPFPLTSYAHERMKAIVLPEISFAINW